MDIYRSLEEVPERPERGRMVAIGVFDGVHLGHQDILGRTVERARRFGASCAAVTFYPHPEVVLRPRSAPRMLTSLERKAVLIAGLGVDELVVVRFDKEFAHLSPAAFCDQVLSERLGAREVFVGLNFRFGRGAAGSLADLSEYGGAHGFRVVSVGLAEEGGEVISSTRIRKLLARGEVAEAARLLGRPHRLGGTVVRGAGRGRGLQAPTANLEPDRRLAIPRRGVYLTLASVGDAGPRPSLTSVGSNPTFENDDRIRVEPLLLDFAGDLYGAQLQVDFLERVRDQRTYADAASLAERIKEDIRVARAYFAGAGAASAPCCR
jgi:riboflavin kinase / FMN adenylyltransferase